MIPFSLQKSRNRLKMDEILITYVRIMKLYKNKNNASLEFEALVNHLQ